MSLAQTLVQELGLDLEPEEVVDALQELINDNRSRRSDVLTAYDDGYSPTEINAMFGYKLWRVRRILKRNGRL